MQAFSATMMTLAFLRVDTLDILRLRQIMNRVCSQMIPSADLSIQAQRFVTDFSKEQTGVADELREFALSKYVAMPTVQWPQLVPLSEWKYAAVTQWSVLSPQLWSFNKTASPHQSGNCRDTLPTEIVRRPHDIYDIDQAPHNSGTFATVYRSHHRESGITYAMKRYELDCPHGLQEIEILKRLDHPGISRFHESFIDDYLWVVTDFIDGDELGERLFYGDVSQDSVRTLMKQMLQSVKHVHESGLLHRDLKPENFLINADATKATMIDLGFASEVGNTSRHGSKIYAAPELFLEDGVATEATDVWALGVVLFLMETGVYPWSQKDEDNLVFLMRSGEIQEKIEKGLEKLALRKPRTADLVNKMLKFHPQERISVQDAFSHPALQGTSLNVNDLQFRQDRRSLFQGSWPQLHLQKYS